MFSLPIEFVQTLVRDNIMKTFLARVLSIPFSIVAFPFLFLGFIFLFTQIFWFLYLGEWFSADEILHALDVKGKFGLGEYLQFGSLDSNYIQNKFISAGNVVDNWPALNKLFLWVVSFHPVIAGAIFASPAALIHLLLGVKLPD
jgi:hypothetical protein